MTDFTRVRWVSFPESDLPLRQAKATGSCFRMDLALQCRGNDVIREIPEMDDATALMIVFDPEEDELIFPIT